MKRFLNNLVARLQKTSKNAAHSKSERSPSLPIQTELKAGVWRLGKFYPY